MEGGISVPILSGTFEEELDGTGGGRLKGKIDINNKSCKALHVLLRFGRIGFPLSRKSC